MNPFSPYDAHLEHSFEPALIGLGKIEDYGELVHGGRVDVAWPRLNQVSYIVEKTQPDTKHLAVFSQPVYACERFSLRSIEFGNWMNQRDRYDQLSMLVVSLSNLAKILGISESQIGFGKKLSVALGARGHSRAAAHFEPRPNFIINLTKESGAGSLAHEYAHAIDNYLSVGKEMVSGGHMRRTKISEERLKGKGTEALFEGFFATIYKEPNGTDTAFADFIQKVPEEYYARREEVWARTFEAWIRVQLEKIGVRDFFLAKSKPHYAQAFYPDQDLLGRADKLIRTIASLPFKTKPSGDQGPAASGETSADVRLVPVKDIHENKALFQNRETDFSEESRNRIVNAVHTGSFRWQVFDPVLLWKNPADSRLYILSGHSRTAAFRKLSQEGAQLEGRSFDKIPAKVIQTGVEEAKKIALTSNNLSTRETDLERANYYRNQRKAGKPAKELEAEARELEGRNVNTLLAYSFLDPTGKAWQGLKLLQSADPTSRKIAETLAYWLGTARMRYPELSTSHENELYDWLATGAYGNRPGQISNMTDFLGRVYNAIQKRTQFGQFEADKPLNIKNISTSTAYDAEIDKLSKELSQAKAELDKKRAEFIKREATSEQMERALKPYQDVVTVLQRDLIKLQESKGRIREMERGQAELFGLGGIGRKMAHAIYDMPVKTQNIASLRPTYKQLPSYDHLISSSPERDILVTDGGLAETKAEILRVIRERRQQVSKLARHLYDPNPVQAGYNVWHFVKHDIGYKHDKLNTEEIRTPSRTWKDRFTGVDCEDLAIFIVSLLLDMGYHPTLDIVALNGLSSYGHIFPRLNGIAMDTVPEIHAFGEVAPNITKTMRIERLEGVSDGDGLIYGLGAIAPADDITRQLMDRQSRLISGMAGLGSVDASKELRKTRFAILLNGTPERDIVLDIMPYVDDITPSGYYKFKPGVSIGAIDDYLGAVIAEDLMGLNDDRLDEIEGLGRASKAERKAKRQERRKELKTKLKATVKKVAKKVGNTAKKVAKGVVRFNPATIAARNGLLLAMEMNIFKMAEKLKYGYLSPSEAAARGYDANEHAKLAGTLHTIEKIFTGIGGKPDKLKSAILKGGHGLNGIEGLNEDEMLEGLGFVLPAAIAAAGTLIAKITGFLKKINFSKLLGKAKAVSDKVSNAPENAKNFFRKIKDKIGKKLSHKNKGYNSPEDAAKGEQMAAENPSPEPTAPGNTDLTDAPVNTEQDAVDPGTDNTGTQNRSNDDNKQEKSSNGLVWALGIGVGGFLLFKAMS